MRKSFLLLTAAVTLVLFGCKERAYIDAPGENAHNVDSIPVLVPDTNGIEISIEDAVTLCKALPDKVTTSEIYKITGEISLVKTNPFLIPSKYSNVDFEIIPVGATTNTQKVVCYRSQNLNNIAFRNRSQVPLAGTQATFLGNLTKYNGGAELTNCFITSMRNAIFIPSPLPTCSDPEAGELSVSQAADTATLGRSKYYETKGTVTGMLEFSTSFGNAQILITDGQKTMLAYRCKGLNNSKIDAMNKLLIGDEITIHGQLTMYNGFPQIANGCYISKTNNQNW